MAYIPGFGYLNNPYIVFNDANGKPLSNGTVETYIAGTTTAYNTLKDWNGTYNGAIITLDIYGGCTIIAPETQGLKLIVKTSTGAAYKTFDNVFIGGSNQGYLPGTTTIRVDGADGEIISVGTPDPDDPDKLIFTISLDPAITTQINNNTANVANLINSVEVIENTLTTSIIGSSSVRDFPLLANTSRAIKICTLTRTSAVGWSVGFKIHFAASGYIIEYAGAGIGDNSDSAKVNYLTQNISDAWIGTLAIAHSKWVDNVSDFYLISPAWTSETEKVQAFGGSFTGSGMSAEWNNDPLVATPESSFFGHQDFLIRPILITSNDASINVTASVPVGGTQVFDLSTTAAISKMRGEWAVGVEYFINDYCTFSGTTYICLVKYSSNSESHNPSEDTVHWKLLYNTAEVINVIEVVENENHAATVTIPYGYFNKIANIRSTLSSLTLKMSELPDTDHAYSFHATMTPLSNLGITTFKVVGPGNSILAIGDTLTSKVIRFSSAQLNHLYATLADQTLVTATALISYVSSTHTLSVGTETIVLDGAATEDAYFVCSAAFGVVTAVGAMEFDPPTLYQDVTWLGTAPALVGGKTYEISVVNGCGVIGGSV